MGEVGCINMWRGAVWLGQQPAVQKCGGGQWANLGELGRTPAISGAWPRACLDVIGFTNQRTAQGQLDCTTELRVLALFGRVGGPPPRKRGEGIGACT